MRSLGFARTSMESAILLEVQNLCEILDATQEPIGKAPFLLSIVHTLVSQIEI